MLDGFSPIEGIYELRPGEKVFLPQGCGEPPVETDKVVNVVSVAGNSALLSNGTIITHCGGDQNKVLSGRQIEHEFTISLDALEIFENVVRAYDDI